MSEHTTPRDLGDVHCDMVDVREALTVLARVLREMDWGSGSAGLATMVDLIEAQHKGLTNEIEAMM